MLEHMSWHTLLVSSEDVHEERLAFARGPTDGHEPERHRAQQSELRARFLVGHAHNRRKIFFELQPLAYLPGGGVAATNYVTTPLQLRYNSVTTPLQL